MDSIYYTEDVNFINSYNDVWEIGLAVLTNRGNCSFFHLINDALDSFDLKSLNIIRTSCDLLPKKMGDALRFRNDNQELVLDAILWLEDLVEEFLEGASL